MPEITICEVPVAAVPADGEPIFAELVHSLQQRTKAGGEIVLGSAEKTDRDVNSHEGQ